MIDSYTRRGIIAIVGAVMIHFTFGNIYTIGNMIPYIKSYITKRVDSQLDERSLVWMAAVSLGIQGISMPFGGALSRRYGFRIVLIISCFLESAGIFLTALTIRYSYAGVIMTYALIKGFGLGFGYSVVIAVAASWFPARRGLIVGLIVAGFGCGALVFTPIQTGFINPKNVKPDKNTSLFNDPGVIDRIPNVFPILGGIIVALQIIGLMLIAERPRQTASTQENGGDPATAESHDPPKVLEDIEVNIGLGQILKHIDFYLLWSVMCCVIFPITIINHAVKDFGSDFIQDDRYLSTVLGFSSMFNCGGRVVWGAVADKLSFKIPLCVMLISWSAMLIAFPHLSKMDPKALRVIFAIAVFMLWFLLSGVFALMPAATSTLFGPVYLAVNYGFIFAAFLPGAIASGLMGQFSPDPGDRNAPDYLQKRYSYYVIQFTACGAICLLAVSLAIWIEDRKMNSKWNICSRLTNTCLRWRIQRPVPSNQEKNIEMISVEAS